MKLWPFNKKIETLQEGELLYGSTDWHSHILPGVDDGFKDIEESLKAVKSLEQLGVKNLWLTPHVMEDTPNETRKLRERFEEFKSRYDGKVKLHLASENMLDSLFEDRLENNDFLPLGETGDHLLVETSYFNPPMNLWGLLEQIKHKGYHPVLAHPERYRYMDEDDYRRLKDLDVKFQANYFSLVGAYGDTARKKLEWLLKQNMVDMMGSDLHRNKVLTVFMAKSPSNRKHLEAMKKVAEQNRTL